MNRARIPILAIVTWLALNSTLPARPPGSFSDGKIGFTVRAGDEVIPYGTFGLYLMPRQTVQFEILDRPPADAFAVTAKQGKPEAAGPHRWVWRAPEARGLYPVTIREEATGLTMVLNVFVMVPRARVGPKGYLNGYRIGRYPTEPLRGLEIYKPPPGFVEVTPANESTLVSPHFTLKQFLCKQEGRYPKYLILRERLLSKLEYLLEILNNRGFRADTFFIMSGYRTPYYNHAIGNVKYSRHQWGGAADIFIDEDPKDGVMDDLNGDGRVDSADAAFLYDLIESLGSQPGYEDFEGGLGAYGSTPAHGPFVHVDARGFRARWGR